MSLAVLRISNNNEAMSDFRKSFKKEITRQYASVNEWALYGQHSRLQEKSRIKGKKVVAYIYSTCL